MNSLLRSGEALAKAAQKSCEHPISGSVQGQVEWRFGPPDLTDGSPAHSKVFGLVDL